MKTLILSILLAAHALSAQAGVVIQNWTTPNGARVLFVETHNLPMLDVQIDFPAGSARASNPALASMTHALLDAGIGKGKTALNENAIADRFADLGAQLGGGLDSDKASLSLRVLSEPATRDAALALTRKILSQPNFPADVLKREQARSIAALREAKTQPAAILDENFAALAYGSHPYGRHTRETDVRQLKRSDLIRFHQQHYTASNAVISLVGDLRREEAEQIAAALVADLPQGQPARELPAAGLPQGLTKRIPHPASQAHIAIGMPALKRGDPDQMALSVGNYTLGGGGFNARLMKEVRDKRGLAYGAYSYFAPMSAEGLFQIGLETKAEQAEEAIKVVHSTLEEFLRAGPSEAELAAAKANLVNSFALALDSNRKLLAQIADLGFYQRPLDSLDTYAARVQAVTLEDVRAAFARHVKPENLVTVIVGGK